MPRPGKQPIYTKATDKRILRLLDKPAPEGFARCTVPLLAAALVVVDVQYVCRFLRPRSPCVRCPVAGSSRSFRLPPLLSSLVAPPSPLACVSAFVRFVLRGFCVAHASPCLASLAFSSLFPPPDDRRRSIFLVGDFWVSCIIFPPPILHIGASPPFEKQKAPMKPGIVQIWQELSLRARLFLPLGAMFVVALVLGAVLLRSFAAEQLIEENEPAVRSAGQLAGGAQRHTAILGQSAANAGCFRPIARNRRRRSSFAARKRALRLRLALRRQPGRAERPAGSSIFWRCRKWARRFRS